MLSSIEDLDFENDNLRKILSMSTKKDGVVALITGDHNEIKLTPGLSETIEELRRESAKDREMIRQILFLLERDKK